MMCGLASLRRFSLRNLLLLAACVALCFIVFYSEDDEQRQLRMKQQTKERLRLQRLREIQKTIFLYPDRPPDSTYNINVTLSEKISLEREIPDTRPGQCQGRYYDMSKLPTISVIIPFYNEALSMLLRTVHSILQRTPKELLAEIILVNDHSLNQDLGEPLTQYVKYLPEKVKLVRTKKREGLIRARMIGAGLATGEVLMFQDGHTENNVQWAEPLLREIRRNPRVIIQPHVDQIDQDTIQYRGASFSVPRGGFSWDLRYTWMEMPDHERRRLHNTYQWTPHRTPTLVGCALAVSKQHFLDIGAFDDAMEIWGGENIELAFRNWMCGGEVLSHPCSRVAHTFKPFSYKFDGDREKIVQKNLLRIAELWMDEWATFFYAATYNWPEKRTYLTAHDMATLQKRKNLKKNLNCKPFKWYMENIVPEIPTPPLDAHFYGEPANIKSEACFYLAQDGFVGLTYNCFYHRVLPQNLFYIDTKSRLIYQSQNGTQFNQCVRLDKDTLLLKAGACRGEGEIEDWTTELYSHNEGNIKVNFRDEKGVDYSMCIKQVTNINQVHYEEQMAQIAPCDPNDAFQKWRWPYVFDFNYNWKNPNLR